MEGMKLWPEQQAVVNRFKNEDEGALLLEPGCGKTAITINILKHHINNLSNQSKKILVVCPSIVIKNWEKEFKRFYPDNPYLICASTSEGKKRFNDISKFIDKEYGILVVNYEVATSSIGPLVEKFQPDTIILDESHKVKNPKSKQAKFFLKLRKQAKKAFILTGTVIANSIEDVYQQFLIMDLGKSFGTNFFVFRRKYMTDMNAAWAGSPNYFPKWVTNPRTLDEFKDIMFKKSVIIKTSDMIDLPELEQQTYYVKMKGEQAIHYRNLKKLMMTQIKDEMLIADHALTKLLRLLQITCGHLPDSEGNPTYFKDIEKIDVLKELVKGMVDRNEKVIIWTNFRPDVEIVTRALKDLGIHDILYMTGDQNTAEKSDAEWLFKNNLQFKVIVCNLQSASTGVNLQAAKHAIFFSRNFSYIHLTQAMARNYRGGSIDLHDKILIHNIVTEDTVEELVLESLEQKRRLGNYVLDNLEGLGTVDKDFKQDILDKFLGDFNE